MPKILFFFLPALFLLLIGGVQQQFDQERKANTTLFQNSDAYANRLDAEEAVAGSEAALAEYRYQQGCLFSQERIIEGAAYQGDDGYPLPNGRAICGPDGSTAVMQDGVATQLAFTNNLDVIRGTNDDNDK